MDSGWSSDVSYRARLNEALHAARILTGALDQELHIQKATTSKTVLGTKSTEEDRKALHHTLRSRLEHAREAFGSNAPATELSKDVERDTGDLALDLLLIIHLCLLQKKQDADSRVPIDEGISRTRTNTVAPKEDVGLGIRDVKLVSTLLSLASKWALSSRKKDYDETLSQLSPDLYPRKSKPATAATLNGKNRFEELQDDDEASSGKDREDFRIKRLALTTTLEKWSGILSVTSQDGVSISASTDVATITLRTGIVDYLSALLRIGFGPDATGLASDSKPAPKDAHRAQAVRMTMQLLKFLSTSSAMSALSSVMSHSDSALQVPTIVKSIASRMLSAQLLRPDGVRSLLMNTFGNSDMEGLSAESEEHTSSQGSGSLRKLEYVARLLLTPPQGMPIEVYIPVILPNLMDVLAPDPDKIATPPPQEQMRAAGFALTRISERHPVSFSKALDERVYAPFRPFIPEPKGSSDSADVQVISPRKLHRAVSTLSSFLFFSEPSPEFYSSLFQPILPQLLTLQGFLNQTGRAGGKGKVKTMEIGRLIDDLKKEVDAFLGTWTRLADAKQGSQALIQAIRKAEVGIRSDKPSETDDLSRKTYFWKEEAEGVAIWYGERSASSETDLASLLNDLTFSTLAQQISSGQTDAPGDVPKLPSDLSASLGLQPDPRLIVSSLQKAERKDLAKTLLPLVLDTYMANKIASKAKMLTELQRDSSETRSVLYLQLVLQLFDAFGSDLFKGETKTTLAFIDFSLSSPASHVAEKSRNFGDDPLPYISAKSTSKAGSSLFNMKGDPEESDPVSEANKTEAGEEEFASEEDEELVKTALSLLLSLLEGNTTLSTETEPMLVVISSKIDAFLDSTDEETRSLGKEAKLVLTARKSAVRGPQPQASSAGNVGTSTSAQALGYAQTQETYQEALKLLQDPILPVRAHGLILLRKLVSDNKKEGGQFEHLDPALLPAILDIFLQAIQDEESYLYLNAVQGLSALASTGGKEAIARLVGIYIGRDDRLTSVSLSTREVEKRLRVGEALLQVIQRCGDSLSPNISILVPPLLTKLRDRSLPTVLRSSFISILGTVVEAIPLAFASAGYARDLSETCMDIVSLEMVNRPRAKREAVKMKVQGQEQDVEDEEALQQREAEQKRLDSATITDPKVAHLRRAALLLLVLLVRGARHQLENAMGLTGDDAPVEQLSSLRLPGGSMLPSILDDKGQPQGTGPKPKLRKHDLLFLPERLNRLKELASYVEANDTDSIVRLQAHDCVVEADELAVAMITADLR